MDRLSTVIGRWLLAIAAACSACKSEKNSPGDPLPSRVVVVRAKGDNDETAASFCDVLKSGARFTLPELVGTPPKWDRSSFHWITIWATWCKPCIEEMPMLAAFEKSLQKAGKRVSLLFISVDEEPEALQRFYQSRPTFPRSERLRNPDALPGFLKSLGLGEETGLPIHVFVNPEGRIACVRAAAVSRNHFDVISGLLRI
jgi:thiol-disulfide isomerase/thioredoxin